MNKKTAIIPPSFPADLIINQYDNIIDLSLCEKIYLIESAFSMENVLGLNIENNTHNKLIISDIDNIDTIMSIHLPDLYPNLLKIKRPEVIAVELAKMMFGQTDIDFFSGSRSKTQNILASCEINKIISVNVQSENLYSIMDIINIFATLCYATIDCNLNELVINKPTVITLSNKKYYIRILLTTSLEEVAFNMNKDYPFIFLCRQQSYRCMEDILVDPAVNKIYKDVLKKPLKSNAFYK